MFYQIELPTTTGFLKLPLVIPAFMQQKAEIFIAVEPWLRVIQQHLELCKSARRDNITVVNDRRRILNTNGMNRAAGITLTQADAQKSSLFLVALHQIDMTSTFFCQQNRRYYARKSATASQIGPVIGCGMQLKNLRAIGDMTTP